jgi:hypothetical protein
VRLFSITRETWSKMVFGAAAATTLVAGYLRVVMPWHLRWGVTDAEVAVAGRPAGA